LTLTEKNAKLGRDNNLFKGATVGYSFSRSTKLVFHMQGAWYSPNTLHTMVHVHAFFCTTCLSQLIPQIPLTDFRIRIEDVYKQNS